MGFGETIIPVVGIVAVFGCIGFVSFLYFRTRHRERMALIETGQDASIFRKLPSIHNNLKYGFVSIAIGLALFIGHFLESATTMNDGAGYFSMIFILGGLALLIYYRRAKDDGLEL
ncbi:MAG: hypothetical protein KDC80_27645 [Saprospiraceae bacterium]|nr:hypothetical protein [Saprospiraceae bacterium]